MKHLKLFFALFAMLALGVTNAWGADVTETIKMIGFAGSTATTYVNQTKTGASDKGTAMVAYAFNPKTGQVRGNKTTVAGASITSDDGNKNWSLYNSQAMGGAIKSITITQTATGSTKFQNEMYVSLGTTTQGDVTAITNAQKHTSLNANTITFDIDPSKGYTYFKLLSTKKFGTGTLAGVEVKVTYETASGGGEPEPVIVKTLKSIEVTDMTTNFEIGETFTFDGTCTATYSVTKDDVALADETVEVTPTSVLAPDMTTAGTKEVIVSYTEGEITKTATYNITVENTLPKIVITQNEVAEFTNKYAEYTWTASGISGKIFAYKNSGMQINSKQDGSYVYNTDPIPGYIRKIKIVKAASGTTRNWTPSISETVLTSAGGTTLDQKEVASTTTWEVTGENSYFYLLESGGATVIESITIYYEAVVPQVAAPTFDPIEGTYNSVQNVTISAEEGATIHYTLDGPNPTTESPVYSTPIEIAETKTLKAIAVKDEKVSPIASATYTIKLPLTTMDQIFAKATAVGSTATSVEITFGNWVVSAVKEDGKTAFVTDGTKGFVIFDKDVNLGFSVGNTLSGTATCKVQLYNGFAELTELKSNTAGLSVGSGGTITTQELGATAIETLTGVNTGSLIKINGICSSTDSKYYVAGVQIYTALYDFKTLKVGAEYNITGIYQQYYSTKEMLPRSAADIEEVVGLPTATIEVSNITMEVGQEKAIEATITPDAAQSTVQYAITSGNEYITLEGTTITAVAVGEATITATIAEKADEYKGATKEFTVTVKPQNIAELPFTFNGGKADIENTLGMSQTGLDDDYGSAPKLKFNGAGDNVIVHFDSQAGEFSFVLKQNGQNAGTFTVYESANGEDYTSVWAGGDFGNAQSETIKPTLSESARYVKFEYTTKGASTNYGLGTISIQKADHRAEAGIAWNPATISLTVGDAFTAPTLNNPNSVSDITYESSNEDVATVSDAGVIDLVDDAVGTATITASFAGDATYKPATATCVVIVNEYVEIVSGVWQLVTDAAALKAGDKVIVASAEAVDGKYYALSTTQNKNNRGQADVNKIEENVTFSTDVQVLTLEVGVGENTFAFNTGSGYLYAASSSANHLKTQEDLDANGSWTISIDANTGVATVKAQGGNTHNLMQYNKSSKLFSSYDKPQQGIALYKKMPDYTRDVRQGYYGTICLPNGGTMVGASIFEIAYKDASKIYFDEIVSGKMEAGIPYIFLPNEGVTELEVYYTDKANASAGSKNGLVGSYTQEKLEVNGNNYILLNNQYCEVIGEAYVGENRAYFQLGSIPNSAPAPAHGVRRVSMGMAGQNTATGMENIDASAQPVKTIINGQLYILRGEKMYDAQGKLVK